MSGLVSHGRELRPIQSLKLTEPAVDDFAARCWTDLAHLIGTSAERTTSRRLLAAEAMEDQFDIGGPPLLKTLRRVNSQRRVA